jgi:hypothetical protein
MPLHLPPLPFHLSQGLLPTAVLPFMPSHHSLFPGEMGDNGPVAALFFTPSTIISSMLSHLFYACCNQNVPILQQHSARDPAYTPTTSIPACCSSLLRFHLYIICSSSLSPPLQPLMGAPPTALLFFMVLPGFFPFPALPPMPSTLSSARILGLPSPSCSPLSCS